MKILSLYGFRAGKSSRGHALAHENNAAVTPFGYETGGEVAMCLSALETCLHPSVDPVLAAPLVVKSCVPQL